MIQNSANSGSTVTNVRFGSDALKDVWFNVLNLELPEIVMSEVKLNNRAGTMASIGADTADYTELNVEVILDRDWKVFDTVYDHFVTNINVETGTFDREKKFELWTEFVNGDGDAVRRFNYHDCRLMSFGGLQATPNDETDTLQTINLTFSVMYYSYTKIDRAGNDVTVKSYPEDL